MCNKVLIAVLFMLCPALAAAADDDASKATLSSDSICHTFDSQNEGKLRYTCFVHSEQTLGQDVSSPASRAELIEHKLSAVCAKSTVLSDELFLAEGQPAVYVWRVQAQCTLAG